MPALDDLPVSPTFDAISGIIFLKRLAGCRAGQEAPS